MITLTWDWKDWKHWGFERPQPRHRRQLCIYLGPLWITLWGDV